MEKKQVELEMEKVNWERKKERMNSQLEKANLERDKERINALEIERANWERKKERMNDIQIEKVNRELEKERMNALEIEKANWECEKERMKAEAEKYKIDARVEEVKQQTELVKYIVDDERNKRETRANALNELHKTSIEAGLRACSDYGADPYVVATGIDCVNRAFISNIDRNSEKSYDDDFYMNRAIMPSGHET